MNIDIDLYTARFGGTVSLIAFVVLVLIAEAADIGFCYFLAVFAFGLALFFSWFIRCPSCGHRLGRYYGHMEYCPHCGEPL